MIEAGLCISRHYPKSGSSPRHDRHQQASRARLLGPAAGPDGRHARHRNRADRGPRRSVPVRRASRRNQPARGDYEGVPAAVHLFDPCEGHRSVRSISAYRVARGLRTTGEPGRYRGLEPVSKLILTHKGYKFHLNTKRGVSWAGEPVEYLACDSLESHVTKLFRDASTRGGSSHSGRRTMASRLIQQGEAVETVQLLLGHAELDHVRPYLQVS